MRPGARRITAAGCCAAVAALFSLACAGQQKSLPTSTDPGDHYRAETRKFARRGATLTVVVKGVRSEKGTVRVGIYDKKEIFPKEGLPLEAVARPARASGVRVTFRQLPAGRYAIAAYHDADDDRTIDRTLLGSATEGLGFSGGAQRRTSEPTFDEAAFQLDRDGTIEIHLVYGAEGS